MPDVALIETSAVPAIDKRRPRRPHSDTVQRKRQMRRDYMNGIGSLPYLCNKYAVSMSSAKRWSVEESWQKLRDEANLRDIVGSMPPKAPEAPVLSPTQDRINRIELQMTQLETAMQDATPDVQAKLANAHDKMFRAWQVLSGMPNPGSRKVRQERSPRGLGRSLAGPMEAAPAAPQSVPETLPVVIPPAAPEVKP